MKKLLLLLLVSTALLSCSKDDTRPKKEPEEEPISLKVVNNVDYMIKSVKLVGYDFSPVGIKSGESQTFELSQGMPAGLKNINITVVYGSVSYPANWTRNITLNFNKTGVTTLTVN